MSKRIRILAVLAIAISLLSSSIFARYQAVPQRKAAVIAAGNARGAPLAATTAALLKETSLIRELPILHPVKSGAQSRIDIERMVVRNLDEQTSPAESHATEQTMKKLGMAPADFHYRPFLIGLLTEQVAGYFDPKQQEFFLADWIDLEGQKPVMAHELTHALQDQHFDLRRFQKWPRGDSDAELAAHALIEGDATLAMRLYMARNPMAEIAFKRTFGSDKTPSTQFKQAPRGMRESLVFPYQEGFDWASAVYKKGGWAAVSKAFSELPQSTEQILHPEKYFAKEAPVKIELADVRAQLGIGWKRIDYDVHGEWNYYLILDQFLNSKIDSRRAAAGWSGDRYEVYESTTGKVFMVQVSEWDTDNDAQEFFNAYAKRTQLRYALGSGAEMADTHRREWNTREGVVTLTITGRRVLILEGIPNGMDAATLERRFSD
ncbi:MAG TPA: hypothetical protein VN643_05175 [Pyrinomonadaceae bacterium]|nr:hypothetical protein [Pyrinomonadaceae bacterium]